MIFKIYKKLVLKLFRLLQRFESIKYYFFLLKHKNKKYILKPLDIVHIFTYGSNHRKRYGDLNAIKLKKYDLPYFLNPWECETKNDLLNIVIGDSHSEFASRIYRDLYKNNNSNPIMTLCIHTGPTTLIGSLLSNYYYDSAIENILFLVKKYSKMTGKLRKVNIFFSLGEIDIRTKIKIEALLSKTESKTVIDNLVDHKLCIKLNYFQDNLRSVLATDFTLSFLIPPPTSPRMYINPLSKSDLKFINKFFHIISFPCLGSTEERISNYKYLINVLRENCLKAKVEFLENKYYEIDYLNSHELSHDLIHISKGNAAFYNSSIIYWPRKKLYL